MVGTPPAPGIHDREVEALAEIAATRVARRGAWSLVVLFLLASLLGAASELVPLDGRRISPRSGAPVVALSWTRIRELWRGAGWKGVDDRIRLQLRSIRVRAEHDSAFSRLVRPPLQSFLLSRLNYGNGQVLPGEDGWLFFHRPFYQAVAPPFLAAETLERRARPGASPYRVSHPDPAAGLLRLNRALARRGTRLVFLPVPDKEQVYPERLASGTWTEAPVNPSYDELLARLEAGGVPVFDAPRLLFRAARSRSDLYAAHDAHWAPPALDLVAAGLADFLRERLGPLPGAPVRFESRRIRHRLLGDIANVLGFALDDGPRSGLEFEAVAVLTPDGRPFVSRDSVAPILVLGDSFSVVYRATPGVGGAGLAEHLALHTQRRVGQLADPRLPGLADRIRLLASRPAALAAARVLVYEVATRGLGTFNWQFVPLGPKPEGRGKKPRPGAVP